MSLAELLRSYLGELDPLEKKDRRTRLQIVTDTLYAGAKAGSVQHVRVLLERAFGRAPEEGPEPDEPNTPPAWIGYLEAHPEEREKYLSWYRDARAEPHAVSRGMPRFYAFLRQHPEVGHEYCRFIKELRLEESVTPEDVTALRLLQGGEDER